MAMAKNIYIYKDCGIDKDKLVYIRSYFNEDNIIEFKDFKTIPSCAEEKANSVCLITLTQVGLLKKNDFTLFLNKIGYCKYIILINHEEADRIKRLMKTAGKGFLLRDDSVELIIDCIENTIRYGGYISPRIVALLNVTNTLLVDAQYKFTYRHRTVLLELLKGKSDKMIANSLKISYHTIKTHRKKLYKILNIKSQGELFVLLH
jgi:DNA-binding NarL/FixJ family response regulator